MHNIVSLKGFGFYIPVFLTSGETVKQSQTTLKLYFLSVFTILPFICFSLFIFSSVKHAIDNFYKKTAVVSIVVKVFLKPVHNIHIHRHVFPLTASALTFSRHTCVVGVHEGTAEKCFVQFLS